ncbi:MAG: hypothetical protein IPN36_09290 [Bacteroidetes bacterium]|nr:hypothetical protein [Bacteroidota bacterium]
MKALATIFLSAYLFAQSIVPGNILSKTNEIIVLLEHFEFHKLHSTSELSFYDFLILHYGNSEHEKSDIENHKRLPLRHKSISNSINETIFIVEHCKVSIENHSLIPEYCNEEDLTLPNQKTIGVFHPPKV